MRASPPVPPPVRRGAGAGAHQRRRHGQPAHRAGRALRRHGGQDRRRGRRVFDAVAAGRGHAAGDRPDRRVLPVRGRADGRGRCAEDRRRPAGAHHARRPARQVLRRQGAARRALCHGGGEAGAHGGDRSQLRRPQGRGPAAGGLQRRRRGDPRRAQGRAARAQLGAAAGRPRAAAAGRPAGRAAGEDRPGQLGAHRDHAGPAGRRAHRHLARPRRRQGRRRRRRRGSPAN